MKCALIGLGMVSKTYADAIRNSKSVDLSLVYARSADSRRAFLDAFPGLGAQEATNVEEIAASDVDFVIVTTPPNAREAIVRALVAAGKPILMEKPVERTLAAASGLVTLCEEGGCCAPRGPSEPGSTASTATRRGRIGRGWRGVGSPPRLARSGGRCPRLTA